MPPTRRRRRKFGSGFNLPILIFLFLTTFVREGMARQYVGPVHRLQCLTCKTQKDDTTELDQFKVRQGLLDPWCDMEPVECAPQQDTCVTVTMQVSTLWKQRNFLFNLLFCALLGWNSVTIMVKLIPNKYFRFLQFFPSTNNLLFRLAIGVFGLDPVVTNA